MSNIGRNLCKAALAGIIGLVGVSAPALADNSEQVIEYRKNVMKAIGGLTGASVGILRDRLPYEQNLIEYARTLQMLTADIPGLFPEGSDFGETDAREEVWTQRDKFEKAATDTHQAATALVKAVEGGNPREIGLSFQRLGQSCRACHDDFRVRRD